MLDNGEMHRLAPVNYYNETTNLLVDGVNEGKSLTEFWLAGSFLNLIRDIYVNSIRIISQTRNGICI